MIAVAASKPQRSATTVAQLDGDPYVGLSAAPRSCGNIDEGLEVGGARRGGAVGGDRVTIECAMDVVFEVKSPRRPVRNGADGYAAKLGSIEDLERSLPRSHELERYRGVAGADVIFRASAQTRHHCRDRQSVLHLAVYWPTWELSRHTAPRTCQGARVILIENANSRLCQADFTVCGTYNRRRIGCHEGPPPHLRSSAALRRGNCVPSPWTEHGRPAARFSCPSVHRRKTTPY